MHYVKKFKLRPIRLPKVFVYVILIVMIRLGTNRRASLGKEVRGKNEGKKKERGEKRNRVRENEGARERGERSRGRGTEKKKRERREENSERREREKRGKENRERGEKERGEEREREPGYLLKLSPLGNLFLRQFFYSLFVPLQSSGLNIFLVEILF